jgi:hypothetical protein
MNNLPSYFRRGPGLHGEAGSKKICSARLAVQSVSRRTAIPPRRALGGADEGKLSGCLMFINIQRRKSRRVIPLGAG